MPSDDVNFLLVSWSSIVLGIATSVISKSPSIDAIGKSLNSHKKIAIFELDIMLIDSIMVSLQSSYRMYERA